MKIEQKTVESGDLAGSGVFIIVYKNHKCDKPYPYEYDITTGTKWKCECGIIYTLRAEWDQRENSEVRVWE